MLLFKRYNYDPKKDLIGKGGFSRVYKAWDTVGKIPVALKVYKANELTERYSPIAEIKRVIGLEHPNICKYLGIEEIEEEDSFGQVEKIQVCVMELLDGGSFAGYYNLNKDITVFKKLLIDVLHGISYLHKNGIIHRDIKPANILVSQTTEGRPVAKITDFGLSKRADALENSSSSGLLISVPYMAPEQLNPEKYAIDEKIHPNIDLWSIGVTVYEILSNDILFKNHQNDSPEQVMANIISQDIPEKIKKLPEPFSKFVSLCLVKDAKLRVKTADELEEILGPISTEEKTGPAIEQNPRQELPGLTVISEDDTRLISLDDTILLPSHDNDEDDKGDETRLITQKKPGGAETKNNTEDIVPPAAPAKNTFEAPPPSPIKADKEDSGITLFNRYTYNPLTDLIGRGGFSRVYRANDKKLGRLVALKIYKTSEFSDRYSPIAEIRRVVNLDHPNICRYLDIEEIEKLNPFGETEKVQVCVMELLDSGNFSEYFTQSGKNIDTFKKLLQDVLHGIAYLHKNGIIHRDIKPANILIKKTIEGPVAKITDFGISKVTDSINNHTSSALIVSIPYMAPEQLNIKKYGINGSIGFNLDLWSLGVTIYEVITGNVLFKNSEQDSSEQIMANIMAPELPEKIKVLPQPFRNIVSHCIVKNANERAQKAEELLVLLNSTIADEPPAPVVQEIVASIIPEPIYEIPDPPKPVLEAKPEVEIKKPEPEPEPLPEKPVQAEIKRKIFIAEPAPEVEKRARKRINILKFSIAGAILLLILACVFYFNLSKEEKNVEPVSQNNDNAKNKVDTVVQVSDDSTKVTDTSINSGWVSNEQPTKKNVAVTKEKEKPLVIAIPPVPKELPLSKPRSPLRIDVRFISACTGILNKDGSFYMKLDGRRQGGVLEEGTYDFEIICDDGNKHTRKITISSAKRSKNGIQVVTL